MDAAELDPVDALIVAESPQIDPQDSAHVTLDADSTRTQAPRGNAVWVLNRPRLVPLAGHRVKAWADDCRDFAGIPSTIRLNPLTASPQDLDSLTSTSAPTASPPADSLTDTPPSEKSGERRPGPSSGQHRVTGHPSTDRQLVWLDLPQSLDALDELLGCLWHVLGPDAHIIAGGRIKHMTRSMNDVTTRWFDEVHASLGVRKARVLHISRPRERPAITGAWPRSNTVDGLTIHAHGGVFHTTGLDAGTALLLSHLDDIAADVRTDVVDLGCGNGIIAAQLARRLPTARAHATDVSWQAVDSTRRTATANGLDVITHWCDGLADLPDASMDAVVTNPPFHRGAAQDHASTFAMLTDAARVLRPGGALWCVYNNHLPWAAHLRRFVGPTRQVTRNRHYTVTRTVRE